MAVQNSLVLIETGLRCDATRSSVPCSPKSMKPVCLIVATALKRVDVKLAEERITRNTIGKPFFPQLLEYITGKLHSAPGDRVLALVYRGEDAIQKIRENSRRQHQSRESGAGHDPRHVWTGSPPPAYSRMSSMLPRHRSKRNGKSNCGSSRKTLLTRFIRRNRERMERPGRKFQALRNSVNKQLCK